MCTNDTQSHTLPAATLQVATAAVWQIDAVLVPATSSPSPAPQLKSLTTLLSGGSTFAAALAAAPSLATAVKQSSFRGTLLAPTDQVGAAGTGGGLQ